MMQKKTEILRKGRYVLPALLLVAVVAFAVFFYRIRDIADMMAFLPEDSPVKEGMGILAEEFDREPAEGTIRLMGVNLSKGKKQVLLKELQRIDHVKEVVYSYDSDDHNNGRYSLIVVKADCAASGREMKLLEEMIATHICPRYDLVYDTDGTGPGSNGILSVSATVLRPFAVLSYRLGAKMSALFVRILVILLMIAVAGLPFFLRKLRFLRQGRMALLVLLAFLWVTEILFFCGLRTSFFVPKHSEITELFPWTETIEVLYDTAEEEKIEKLTTKLEKEDAVRGVTAYSTTLGTVYSYVDMAKKVAEISQNREIDPWLVSLIYYDHSGCEIPSLPLGEFLEALRDFRREKPELTADIDGRMSSKLDILAVFADKDEIAGSKTAAQTAKLFGIDEKLTGDIYQVSGKEEMSLAEFIQAVRKYSGADFSVPSGLMEQIELASLFADPEEYSKERTAAELSQIFGVEETTLSKMLKLSGKKTASIKSLVGIVSSNTFIYSMLSSEITEKLYVVNILTNSEEMEKKRSAEEISKLFGIDKSLLSIMGDERMSIAELMELAKRVNALPDLASMLDSEGIARIEQLLTDTGNDRRYTPSELAELLEKMAGSLGEERVALIYKIHDSQNTQFTELLSVEQFLELAAVLSETPEYEGLFDEELKKSLAKAAGRLANEKRQLVGKEHSVLLVSAQMSERTKENDKVLEDIEKRLDKALSGSYYPVGNASLQRELKATFSREFVRTSIVIWAVFLLAGVLMVIESREEKKDHDAGKTL